MLLILIATTVWVLLISLSRPNTIINNKYTSYFTIFLLFVYVSILLVTTDNISLDMKQYIDEFLLFDQFNIVQALGFSSRESLFVIFQWLTAQISNDPRFFYFSIWLVFATLLIFSLRRMFKPWQLLVVFFVYLNFFLTFNYITNTVRQGLAISIILVAVTTLIKNNNNKLLFYTSIIVAPFLHNTSIVLSLALLIIRFRKFNLRTLLILWSLFSLLYITNLNSSLLSPLSSFVGDIESYTSSSIIESYGSGVNRLDFLIFSVFWIIYSCFLYSKTKNEQYKTLIRIYIAFNIYFLAFGFIAYSDRIAAYSWFLIPLLVLYPLFKLPNRRLTVSVVIIAFIIVSISLGSLLYSQPIIY